MRDGGGELTAATGARHIRIRIAHTDRREADLSAFDACYKNDETGAPVYDPAILLKIILYAYSKGVTSSRRISELCVENVIFMALAANSAPHFTTIADFVATRKGAIERLFRDVQLVCEEAGLIGRACSLWMG